VTTQAATTTPSGRASDSAGPPSLAALPRYLAQNAPEFFRHVWNKERHWVYLLIPVVILVLYTYTLARKSWGEFDSSLILQPFVPILAAWLVLQRREQLAALYRDLAFAFPDDSPKRRGNVWGLAAGCLLLALSSFAMLAPMALLGLIIAVAGGVYLLYGPFILRALWQPLLFLLIMVPPPAGILARLTGIFQMLGALVTTHLFSLIYPKTEQQGIRVLVNGAVPLDITPPLSGASIVVPLLMLTLWLCILRRVRVAPSLVILIFATLIGVALNLVRLLALGIISVNSPQLGELLLRAPSWLLVAVGFYATFLVMKRITAPRRRPEVMLEDDEDEDDLDLDDLDDTDTTTAKEAR
jgi:hypothetical protein